MAPITKTKTRVGVVIRESLGGKSSSNKSADLVNLSQKYQDWCKKIRVLIEALQTHHESMKKIQETRANVAKSFASMTKDTPMWECCGQMPSANRPSDSVCSYSSIHDALGAKTLSYADKYKQFVIDYATEWEKVVTARIDAGLKKAEELRRDLDHYQKKVEAMRLAVNQSMAKGKSVKSDQQEKLRRNEEKLMHAKQNYNKAATDLCILMEEVTERSWRDLHPLLVKCAQFDSTLSNDESKALSTLNSVVTTLKQVATANGISPQPRLKDLATLQPELLSTRPGGVAGLAIEAGPMPSNLTSSMGGSSSVASFDNQALTPGSVAPQGLGGFPVQISSSSNNNDPYATSGLSSSGSNAYDPLSMLSISQASAPAPTYEDVYSSHRSAIQSAPTSGNLPPLAPGREPPPRAISFDGMAPLMPSGMTPQPARTCSFGNASDVDSAYSGYSGYYSAPPTMLGAPAPAAPPPPPPSMPPPPPPSASMNALTLSGSSGQPSPYSYNYGMPPPSQQPVGNGGTNPFGF